GSLTLLSAASVFTNAGTFNLNGTGFQMSIQGGAAFTNTGTVNWGNTGGLFILSDSVFNNAPGGVVNVTADPGISALGNGTFTNRGTFRKTGGTGATQINSIFNNTGLVEALVGSINLGN